MQVSVHLLSAFSVSKSAISISFGISVAGSEADVVVVVTAAAWIVVSASSVKASVGGIVSTSGFTVVVFVLHLMSGETQRGAF
jgi:hypothetical protein